MKACTLPQIQIMISRIGQRILRLEDVEYICQRDKLYVPHLYQETFHDSLKHSIKLLNRVLERLYNQWELYRPLPQRTVDFIIGGSHRKLEQHRRLLAQHGIHYRTIGNRQWGVYDLKVLIEVNAHHYQQMKVLKFSRPRKRKELQ